MFANEISVIANVIPRASASWEISLEYDGNPPVAKPITKPLATIVGKLRHGRNTQARDDGTLKSLPNPRPRKSGRRWRSVSRLVGDRSMPPDPNALHLRNRQ